MAEEPNPLESTQTTIATGSTNERVVAQPVDNEMADYYRHLCFQILHWLDVLIAVMVIFFLCYTNADRAFSTHVMFAILTPAVLWISRGVMALATEDGVSLSATMSLFFVLLYTAMLMNSFFFLWWCPPPVDDDYDDACIPTPLWFPWLVLFLALFEMCRYYFIRYWMMSPLLDHESHQGPEQTTEPSHSRGDGPNDPLLPLPSANEEA